MTTSLLSFINQNLLILDFRATKEQMEQTWWVTTVDPLTIYSRELVKLLALFKLLHKEFLRIYFAAIWREIAWYVVIWKSTKSIV